MPRVLPILLLLLTTSAFAQNADLTLRVSSDARYNAGEIGTLRATLTNLGPDDATAAGVRLAKPAKRFVPASQFGCIEIIDDVLCNTPMLKAGESHDFVVPFIPPDDAGTIQLNAHTESFTADPNHENDAASVTAKVVKLADLSLTFDVSPSLRTQQESLVYLTARNQAALHPDAITVFVTIPDPLVVVGESRSCENVDASTYRCDIRTFGFDTALYFDVMPAHTAPPVTITASVESSQSDWNPADNRASRTVAIYDVPNLDVKITSPDALDDNNRTVVTYEFTNPSDVPATNVSAEIVTVPATPDPIVTGDWSCKPSSTYRLLCSTPLIAPHTTSTLRVGVQFAAKYVRGSFGANVLQKSAPDFFMVAQSFSRDAVFYRPFVVTTDADSGVGSLRQAILDANATCSDEDGKLPCAIRFSDAFTIALRSALPLITVTDFAIDGEGRVTLDGSDAGDSDGLYLYSAAAVVRGMKIAHFAKNGVLSITHRLIFVTRHHVIENNDLSDNGLRGLMTYMYEGEITGNVISGNRRSGIFLTDNSTATIRDNRIDGNGASGIYLGAASNAVIEHNTIANSPAFGIAIDRLSGSSQIFENKITHNGLPGIDFGLDGPTLERTPVITSARFDASTGETLIEGVIPVLPVSSYEITDTAYIYANTIDEAGGEIFLGTAVADHSGHFTLRYKGDLTGKYIDAMSYQVIDFGDYISRGSSEFGSRLRV